MRPTICVLLAALCTPAIVSAQLPGMPRDSPAQKIGRARLSGQIRSAETGKPLRRALVRATRVDVRDGDARAVSLILLR